MCQSRQGNNNNNKVNSVNPAELDHLNTSAKGTYYNNNENLALVIQCRVNHAGAGVTTDQGGRLSYASKPWNVPDTSVCGR